MIGHGSFGMSPTGPIFPLPQKLIVQLLHEDAKIPTYGTKKSAGFDLYSPIADAIKPGERKLISLGLKIKIPDGFYVKIVSRSGHALRFGVEAGAGTIDSDYYHELGVLLHNHGNVPFLIAKGDRIAQGILRKYYYAEFVEGEVTANEGDTRIGGFGSTGT